MEQVHILRSIKTIDPLISIFYYAVVICTAVFFLWVLHQSVGINRTVFFLVFIFIFFLFNMQISFHAKWHSNYTLAACISPTDDHPEFLCLFFNPFIKIALDYIHYTFQFSSFLYYCQGQFEAAVNNLQ